MRRHPSVWERIYAMHARAQQVCVEVQQTRWQAAQVRHHARLMRLARHMPEADSITLALTAVLLRQRRLLAHPTPYLAVARRPPLSDRIPAPSGTVRSPRSPTGLPSPSSGASAQTRVAPGQRTAASRSPNSFAAP